jgi:hypothetical protein
MNQALEYYKNDDKIFSISGYCPPVLEIKEELKQNSDYYLYHWNLSWGYGIWKEKYNKLIEFEDNFCFFKQNKIFNKINSLGGMYISDAIYRDHMHNGVFPDAWLCAKMTYFGYNSIVPSISKVNNIGSASSFIIGADINYGNVGQIQNTSRKSFLITKQVRILNN